MDIELDGKAVYINTGGMEWQDGHRALCLVHGASLDHSVWMLFSRYFARHGFNLIVPDLPGHGRSEGPLLGSIEEMGGWLNALLAATANAGTSNAPVTLAGHSMGSLVALQAAGADPSRYSHLCLLGAAYPMAVGEALLEAAKDNDSAAIDMVSIFGHGFAAQLGGNPVAGINVMQSAMTLMSAAGPGVMYTGLNACNEYQAGEQAAQAVTAKTTLVLGKQDMMTPPRRASMLAELMAASSVELANSGHMMMAEAPEETLQALLQAFKA